MNILFITTHNLATNPRVYKEIHLALKQGFEVQVLSFEFWNWSKKLNDLLLRELQDKATVHVLPSARRPFLPWFSSTVAHLAAQGLLKIFPSSKYLLSVSLNKRSFVLLQHLKKISDVDLVIGHNIGSFYPAYLFAKKNKIPFGIDLEDYHAGETKDTITAKRIKRLCNGILPAATYISAASPLILEYTLSDLHSGRGCSFVVQNSASLREFVPPQQKKGTKLRLVWFSQNISKDRGLEYIIPVIHALSPRVELYLYGNLNTDFFETYLKDLDNVIIHPPLPQETLHKSLAQYDIGLAVEPNKDVNNTVALSNKIIAYTQAGLYIIASDTKAQVKWMHERPHIGEVVCLHNKEALTDTLTKCIEMMDTIRSGAEKRYNEAKELCWEIESKKLLQVWSN